MKNRSLLYSLVLCLVYMTPLTAAAQAAYAEEFNGGALPAGWTAWDGYAVQHPGDTANHASFQMTGSQLSVGIPGVQEHNMWWLKHASVLRQFSGSGIYEVKVDSAFTGDQQLGLIFQKDSANFMIFMLYAYTGDTVRAYVERFSYVDGQQYKHTFAGGSLGVSTPASGPFYVRVAVTDDPNPADRSWTFSWSPNGSNWTSLVSGQLEGAPASENAGAIQSVGVFAGNQPHYFNAFDARFDHFRYYTDENSLPTPAPSNLVSRGSNGRVDLWWEPVSGATSYRVYTATAAEGPYSLLATTAQPSHSHLGVTNNVARYYAVSALVSGVEGPKSAYVKAVPHVLGNLDTLPSNGLTLALSASELAYVLEDGASVEHWPSAAGPMLAASGSPQRRPTYVASGLNGQPVLRFDGVDDYLTLPAGFQDFTAGMSLYVVMRPTVPQNGFKLLLLGNGPDQQNIGLGRAGSTSGYEYFTDSSSAVSWFNTPDGLVAGQPSLLSVIQGSGTADGLSFAELAKNGVPLFGQNMYVPPVANRATNYIGKSYWSEGAFQGDIAEILLYQRALNPQEHAAVLDYVEQKYGLGPDGGNPSEPLPTPTQLTATAGDASVELQWGAVEGANGYRLYRAVGESQSYVQIADQPGTSYSDAGLSNGTTYKYKVSAYDADEESPQSSSVSAQPQAQTSPIPGLPGAGLILALSAETAALQYSHGQAVTVWQDLSASNYDATAGTDAPTLITNALNGKPVLRFDGSNDFLQLPNGFQNFTAGMSLYIVARPTVLQQGFKFLVLGNGAGQQNIGLGRAGSTSGFQFWTDNSGGGVDWFDTAYGLEAGETSLISVIQTGGLQDSASFAEIAKNGAVVHGEHVFVPPVAARGLNYIGKSYWNEGMFQGDIAEILIYNRTLNAQERSAVHAYIAQKYGLALP